MRWNMRPRATVAPSVLPCCCRRPLLLLSWMWDVLVAQHISSSDQLSLPQLRCVVGSSVHWALGMQVILFCCKGSPALFLASWYAVIFVCHSKRLVWLQANFSKSLLISLSASSYRVWVLLGDAMHRYWSLTEFACTFWVFSSVPLLC